jgi:peptide deformylase
MAVLRIVRLGHPALRTRATRVSKAELVSAAFQRFLDDLVETCVAADGAGIAAPQVAVSQRIIVVNVGLRGKSRRHGVAPTIVVNPVITSRSKETEDGWEGDLSSNLQGIVPRAKRCTVTGWNRHGAPVSYRLTGFPARVFQHEIDHLHGIFLLDRVRRRESIAEPAEWLRHWVHHDERSAGGRSVKPARRKA